MKALEHKSGRRGPNSVHLHGRLTADYPEYQSWNAMRQRCSNPNSGHYYLYGARGITVCEAWSKFSNFIKDMWHRPTPGHTLERVNNNGNYEKSNCKWATRREQQNNRRTNRLIEFNGKTMTITAWAISLGMSHDHLSHRLGKLGWSVSRALTTPLKQYDTKRPTNLHDGQFGGK